MLVREETWRRIAEEACRPSRLLGRGKMSLRGNVEDSGDKELLILWFNPAGAFSVSLFRQLAWLTLLREALVGSLRVRISHEDDSAEALEVRLLAPARP